MEHLLEVRAPTATNGTMEIDDDGNLASYDHERDATVST